MENAKKRKEIFGVFSTETNGTNLVSKDTLKELFKHTVNSYRCVLCRNAEILLICISNVKGELVTS